MTPAERRKAQRQVAAKLKKGESPLGGKYREIVRRATERGPLFKSLDEAIAYAKQAGKPTFIVARGTPKDKARYRSSPRWLSLGGLSDPSFHEYSRGGYRQEESKLFGEATSYRVMQGIGHSA